MTNLKEKNMEKTYYQLNYEISSWFPKGSIWYEDDDGCWRREDSSRSVGNGDYWFGRMLEQESSNPSTIINNDKPIISRVERRTIWVEVKESQQ